MVVMVFYAVGVTLPIFKAFPREEAGEVVRVLFPHYYGWMYGLIGSALLALILSQVKRKVLGVGLVLGALGLILVNQFGLNPAMEVARLAENTAKFGKLHGFAMIFNLIALIFLAGAMIFVRKKL